MGGILFVCTGNTCRSPLAEVFAKELYPQAEFFSRGISSQGGGASAMSVKVMSEIYGLSLSGHVSRQLNEEDVRNSSLILTMTDSHKRHVLEQFPSAADKIFTLYGFAFKDGDESFRDICDPYMGSFDVYAACAAEIKRCIEHIGVNYDFTL